MKVLRLALACTLVALASRAGAQDLAALRRSGWVLHENVGIGNVSAVACGGSRAYARSWSGGLAVWDGGGATWHVIVAGGRSARHGRALAASPDGQVFLATSQGVAQWTGSRWIDHALDQWEGEHSWEGANRGTPIAAPSATEVLYVGRGRVARFDGERFTTYDAGTWRSLTAVAVAGRTLWLGGQGGTIMRHDGRRFVREETGITTWVRGIVVLGPDDVWAWADGASENETFVLRRSRSPATDGPRWERRDAVLGHPITAIGGTSDRVYATGDFGLARWDGSTWLIELSADDLGRHDAPDGVCATDSHYIVGFGTGILVRPR